MPASTMAVEASASVSTIAPSPPSSVLTPPRVCPRPAPEVVEADLLVFTNNLTEASTAAVSAGGTVVQPDAGSVLVVRFKVSNLEDLLLLCDRFRSNGFSGVSPVYREEASIGGSGSEDDPA
jgi:hypothetical protein